MHSTRKIAVGGALEREEYAGHFFQGERDGIKLWGWGRGCVKRGIGCGAGRGEEEYG